MMVSFRHCNIPRSGSQISLQLPLVSAEILPLPSGIKRQRGHGSILEVGFLLRALPDAFSPFYIPERAYCVHL